MSDMNKAWLALIFWTILIFVIGVAIGDKSHEASLQEEITLLSIELTKLEIKKLKGVCNVQNG